MAINPNTNFSVSAVYTADQANRFPRGVMAYATKNSNTAMTTSQADVGLSVTFTAVANRYYKYTFFAYANNSTSASTNNFFLTDSANSILSTVNVYVVGGGAYTTVHFPTIRTETAGTVDRKIRCSTQAGTGTTYGDSTNLMFLLVEDIGPA
jgi:hypothetical protein